MFVSRETNERKLMACYYPVGVKKSDGSYAYRPCGRCIGCKLEYSRQWAIRVAHEASMHDENSFLTLTYNNDNLPSDGSIRRSELKNFIRRLRDKYSDKNIRYFGCGEYGERLGRPHYHVCIFGHDFHDKEMVKGNNWKFKKQRFAKKTENALYKSKELSEVWKKGFSSVGEVSFESAAYVARYVTKKITGEKQQERYGGLEPEFALMSRMPGIGREWIEKYLRDVYPKDFLTINGVKMRPPRYYDSVMEKLKPEEFEQIKKKRSENVNEAITRPRREIEKRQREKHRELTVKPLRRLVEEDD